MLTLNSSFYNRSIRNTVLAFGSLFESIYVTRYETDGVTEKEKIRVPLSYGSKEKFIWKLSQESSLSKNSRVQIVLPKLGFEMTTMLYDPTRKINRTIQRADLIDNIFYKSYSEVPYVISFSLFAFTRNMDDMLQIVEQILPNFTPEYTITIKMNEMYPQVDIPIVLNNLNIAEDYEGTFENRRALISTFDFSVKTYVYPKLCGSTGGIILGTDVNFYDELTTGNFYAGDIGYTGDLITGSITGITGDFTP